MTAGDECYPAEFYADPKRPHEVKRPARVVSRFIVSAASPLREVGFSAEWVVDKGNKFVRMRFVDNIVGVLEELFVDYGDRVQGDTGLPLNLVYNDGTMRIVHDGLFTSAKEAEGWLKDWLSWPSILVTQRA